VVAVDVTSHIKARQAFERANRNLEEFAFVASYDLKEPLRMVKIYSQLLIRSIAGEK
jgi:light-regulated signal transduction histidine kinase (bacteriophytochrome)